MAVLPKAFPHSVVRILPGAQSSAVCWSEYVVPAMPKAVPPTVKPVTRAAGATITAIAGSAVIITAPAAGAAP